jgi:ABC-type multidrug transport system ATPase subunit
VHTLRAQIGTIYKRGISGGQQRRVAVAADLVYGPDVLCLDEPTSGLDTTTAINTITYLRKLLKESNGRSGYLMTIHQPNAEILSLFDDVILMVGGGTVYSGTVAGASVYFNALVGREVGVPGTPVTETHLRLTDTTFGRTEPGSVPQNYPARFQESQAYKELDAKLQPYSSGQVVTNSRLSLGDHLSHFSTLFSRMAVIARRDLTLFHVQYFLQGTRSCLMSSSHHCH